MEGEQKSNTTSIRVTPIYTAHQSYNPLSLLLGGLPYKVGRPFWGKIYLGTHKKRFPRKRWAKNGAYKKLRAGSGIRKKRHSRTHRSIALCKKIEHYKYKRVRKGWVTINCRTGGHSHFRSEFGCKVIIKFLLEGIYPNNPYLQESYKRLQDHSTRKKQKYINKKR